MHNRARRHYINVLNKTLNYVIPEKSFIEKNSFRKIIIDLHANQSMYVKWQESYQNMFK